MAKSKLNVLVREFKGGFAQQFVIRTRGNYTFLSKWPSVDENREPTVGQQSARERFREAVIYAKSVLLDQKLHAIYAAKTMRGKSVYHLAIKDANVGPELSNLKIKDYSGKPGDQLMVRAYDNFMVAAVKFTILDANGIELETGNAIESGNGWDWVFTTNHTNASIAGTIIRVIAEDLPGNRAILEEFI